MPRTYKKKGLHTSPENAGAKNMPENLPQDDSGIMADIYPVYVEGAKKKDYCGQWTDEEFLGEINAFFVYCFERDIKPTMPLLELWLGCSRTQFYEWRTNVQKHGDKPNILGRAMKVMEAYLQANIDKYPTGSTFLLKTTHGHIEQSKLDITTNGKDMGKDDVDEMIKNLGLGE